MADRVAAICSRGGPLVELVAAGRYRNRISYRLREGRLSRAQQYLLRRNFCYPGRTLYDLAKFDQVVMVLRDAGLRVEVSPEVPDLLSRWRRARTLIITEQTGRVYARCLSSRPFKAGLEVLRRFTGRDGGLPDPLLVWPLSHHWKMAGGLVRLDESFSRSRLAREIGRRGVVMGASPEFFRQIQVWYAPELILPGLREIIGGYTDDFDTLLDPLEWEGLKQALEKRGARVLILEDLPPLVEHWRLVASHAPIRRLYGRFAGELLDRGEPPAERVEELSRRVRSLPLSHRLSDPDEPLLSVLLYPFQRLGVSFLVASGSALLADDMGLGKTLQAMAAALVLMAEGRVESALVVCPASLKRQWVSELRRFAGAEALLVEGTPEERARLYQTRARFKVMNYELLWRDEELLKKNPIDLIILDEAQRIKNFRTRTSSALFRLPRRFAFALTGTPLENQLMELFNIMKFVEPRALGKDPLRFRDRYIIEDRFGKVRGHKYQRELSRRLSGVTLRRTREETVEELPPLTEKELWVSFSPEEREIYEQLSTPARELARQSAFWDLHRFGEALTTLLRLREACDSAELVTEGKVKRSAKLEELKLILEERVRQGGHQAVVFTQWTRMLEILRRELSALGYRLAILHGAISGKERNLEVARFNRGEAEVFLATDAGGLGLNLQAASLIVNFDLPFNPAKVAQRIARAHRIGQSRPVVALNLLVRGTVEEHIHEILWRRRELFAHVFGAIEDEGELSIAQLDKRGKELVAEILSRA